LEKNKQTRDQLAIQLKKDNDSGVRPFEHQAMNENTKQWYQERISTKLAEFATMDSIFKNTINAQTDAQRNHNSERSDQNNEPGSAKVPKPLTKILGQE
jgi:hypothetical protein